MDNINPSDEHKINEQFSRQFGKAKDLPNGTASLVLGIVSTVFGLLWCYWIGSLVALICGLVAIVLSNGGKRLEEKEPGLYSKTSVGNNNAGKILGIIGLCLGAIGILLFVVLVLSFGVVLGSWLN